MATKFTQSPYNPTAVNKVLTMSGGTCPRNWMLKEN